MGLNPAQKAKLLAKRQVDSKQRKAAHCERAQDLEEFIARVPGVT